MRLMESPVNRAQTVTNTAGVAYNPARLIATLRFYNYLINKLIFYLL